MSVGDNIKQLRKDKNLTQKQLAKKANLSEISIRRYEKGINEPSTKILKKIADALETPLETMLAIDLNSIASNMEKISVEFQKITQEHSAILKDATGQLSFLSLCKSCGLNLKNVPNEFNEDVPNYNIKYKNEDFNISEDDFQRFFRTVCKFIIKEGLNTRFYDFIDE